MCKSIYRQDRIDTPSRESVINLIFLYDNTSGILYLCRYKRSTSSIRILNYLQLLSFDDLIINQVLSSRLPTFALDHLAF